MAVSRELKDYIIKKFNEKITEINQEKSKVIFEADQEFSRRKRMEAENILQGVREVVDAKSNQLKDLGCSLTYELKNFSQHTLYYLPNFPDQEKIELAKPFDLKITALQNKREKLLIQLAHTKDFDAINQLLGEHGIAL